MDRALLKQTNRVDFPRAITPRFVLYVGFKCNLRCQFCYYLKSIEDKTAKNEDYESLAKKIKRARSIGKTEIDFTGGEATIHPDFPRLIALCKELGFTTINVITNGWKIADASAFKRFADAGLNEVLFSLHSYDQKTHDQLTQIPRSHSRILQAIENAHSLGVRVRINSVVNKINYNDLDRHMKFLKTLYPKSVNLIVFNPTEETVGYDKHDGVRIGSYEDIGKAVSGVLEKYANDFEVVNVRFLPFCYAKGFEEHMRTYWQEIYERQEWDPMLHWAFRKNFLFVLASVMIGAVLSFFERTHIRYGKKNFYTRAAEWFQHFRVRYLFRQKKGCKSCSLRLVCPGLSRDFLKSVPDAKVFPYNEAESPLILNPVAFGYRYPEKFPSIDGKFEASSFFGGKPRLRESGK
jgi:MoaA/NifB/PqqE/SkfB family radical SAM enzyme